MTSCLICTAYARTRGDRIRTEIARTTPQRDRAARWRRFMAGVHDRHLAPARTATKETR